MNVYIAGPMRGYPNFNFPAFHQAAKEFRMAGAVVFNPAERDEEAYGTGISASPTGDLGDVADLGFSLRDALADDTWWICKKADTIAMLPGWECSNGARAEHALALALGHKIIYCQP